MRISATGLSASFRCAYWLWPQLLSLKFDMPRFLKSLVLPKGYVDRAKIAEDGLGRGGSSCRAITCQRHHIGWRPDDWVALSTVQAGPVGNSPSTVLTRESRVSPVRRARDSCSRTLLGRQTCTN